MPEAGNGGRPPRRVSAGRPRSRRRDLRQCRSSARSHIHAGRPPSRQNRQLARTSPEHSAAPHRMDDQWRRHQTPRHGELMQRGGRARRGRDQRKRRNRLRMGRSLRDALHHRHARCQARGADEPPDQPPPDHARSHATPLAPHRRPWIRSATPANVDSTPRQRCHRRFDRSCWPRSFDPPIIDQPAPARP
jgi:hypothetical protein